MAYDLEKYREKRERVLGVKKRGPGFGLIALGVSLAILAGLSVVVIPKSIAFFANRHLEDAIFKRHGGEAWPEPVLAELRGQAGVRRLEIDGSGARLVITFDQAATGVAKFSAFFSQKKLDAVLLNQVGHSQRLHTLKKEAAEGGGQ